MHYEYGGFILGNIIYWMNINYVVDIFSVRDILSVTYFDF